MTEAKKKANELVDKYIEYVEAYSSEGQIENAKICALIAQKNLLQKLKDLNIKDYFEEQVLFEINVL
jgi:LPS O-antigen subunit length determinant protein (WzzB/FepE family)